MTIPTQIRNQPFISLLFLTFQVDTRQSLAASATAGKLAATIHELQLIGRRRGVPFKSRIESTIFDSKSSLSSPGWNCDAITPSAHNCCSHDNRASKMTHAADFTSRGRCTPSCHVPFIHHLYVRATLRQSIADLHSMNNIVIEMFSLSVVDSATICCVEEYVSSR